MSTYIKELKKNIRNIRFNNRILLTCNHFLNNDSQRGWSELKKISKPAYSPSQSPVCIKDKEGNALVSLDDQLHRVAEHYKDLASDVTGHSLNEKFWNESFDISSSSSDTWDINQPISLKEIELAVLSMKNNKAPGPDGIPNEFFKAFFEPRSNTSNNSNTNQPVSYSDCANCLFLLFNKIWDGDFPDEWNSASIVSIPKKGDLSDCNNYRGISLINVGLKILSKIVTKRISDYAFSHGIIRPEQFGFRNKEECISLYISVREICQRRQIKGKFTYLAFLDLKKAYDSVPIFNILTKLYKIGIRGNCFRFLKNLYLTSKARAFFNGRLSEEFPIHRGVRQGCPLSPILFNIFINDVLNKCEQYGVKIGSSSTGIKRCCGGLFADDIVLIAPNRKNLRKLLNNVFDWSNTNEMTFGINKCATLVVKPLHFTKPRNYQDPTFYLGIHPLPKTDQYTYLGIPFHESLQLTPIISKMNSKISHAVDSFFRFLTNRKVPIYFKTRILVSFVLSTILYYAPLLGSNKKNTSKAQGILNRGMFWSFGFYNKTSNTSIYNMSKELCIPPIASFCANAMIRCFNKWKNSSCIIADLVNNIPTLTNSSWTKKSRALLNRKTLKNKPPVMIRKFYWENVLYTKTPAIKSVNYKKYKFGFKKHIHKLTLKYPQFSFGFFWIGRIKCGFKFDVKTYIKRNIVMAECPTCCPCCGSSIPSFTHWVLTCPKFDEFRQQFIPLVDDFFINFSLISIQKSLNLSDDSEKDFEDNINFLVLCLLLGGNMVFDILSINSGERRRFINNVFQTPSNESSLPYPCFVGLAEFLTNVMPIVTSDFFRLIDQYTIRPTVTRSVDVVPIRHRRNSDTTSNGRPNQRGVIIEEWEELEAISSSLIT